MKEEFRDIKDYENLYQISNFGKVKSLERIIKNNGGLYHKKEIILTPVNSRDYPCVGLSKNGKSTLSKIHRLVAEAFIPNPQNKKTVNHKDGNKLNNYVWNLEWATSKEQMNHSIYVLGNNNNRWKNR
jgi:hypothetical protein